jgi:hypothetical protein
MDQLQAAVDRSGYPLQSVVGDLLRPEFVVHEEWSYIDRNTRELRAIDLRADVHLHGWNPQPRVRPQLTLLIECKHSELPYIFFRSGSLHTLLEHPHIAGLRSQEIVISSDDDASTWTYTVIHALDLHEDPFQGDPVYATTFSKCVRKGAELELSGVDAYNGLVLPLIKTLAHLSVAEAPPKTAWYFDAHLAVALGVLDAPMVCVQTEADVNAINMCPWVRVVRHEYDEGGRPWDRNRLWAVDIVHRDFLRAYLDAHLMPFAKRFAERVLRHPTELATGQAFVPKMGADGWGPIEGRLKARGLTEKVKRTRIIGRNVLRLLSRGRGSDGNHEPFINPAVLDTRQEDPIMAGTGRCYSCDCKGYRKSKDTNWCQCGHHWDRHA